MLTLNKDLQILTVNEIATRQKILLKTPFNRNPLISRMSFLTISSNPPKSKEVEKKMGNKRLCSNTKNTNKINKRSLHMNPQN